ncbi:hypothetical protein ACFP1I_24860 [Dyadobacter subterraneus]|uniref:Alpha glucuronidase N-terminal domain-containing protein n=1 Tax=Dyadobacter subterraneus TaxID=2773304 RepID=A0ABR9WNA4_9BACT|nr:hypothetical protein [Dyadobacter subterraneus]MBE9466321.1 hypothetical protein [Dyadobacter subterraneus]
MRSKIQSYSFLPTFKWSAICLVLLFSGFAHSLFAQTVNLKNAVLMVSPAIPSPMKETAAAVLSEEIAKRTGFGLKNAAVWPKAGVPTIALVLSSDTELFGKPAPAKRTGENPEFKKEGYRIVTETSEKGNIIWIIGADSRGILFGSGWLLRNLSMDKNILQLDEKADFATSPDYLIRGHQLGYRTTANTYDAWTTGQFDQYIRELAIFGTNAIEGIPFQEGEAPSPHFKIPSAEMRIRMSEMCQKYDMDYWVWTPATFNLKDEAKRKAEIEMHEEFYKKAPRLDHIFFPGGDPGENHPSDVMPFLKELQSRLVKYHPNAKMWISLQGFSVEQIDYFYKYLETEKPAWLQGVVSGPGSPPMAETRYRLPKQYQHREYPDITHAIRCEFPVEKYDQAFALTLGRESVNPRPYAFAKIHEKYAPFTDGFVSYSDGSHDDVNKVLWSMRAWDVKKDVHQILKEYARFFFGKNIDNAVASGIEALEQNWKGSLAENGGVEMTYQFWKNLESTNPKLKDNWRWQMLLLRGYYDEYTRLRLINEQELEKQANEILAKADNQTITKSMDQALAIVNKADTEPIARDIRKHIEDLSDALYISIGLQTSSAKHKPRNPERGAVMDFVDYPLNNRWWLADEFEKIKKIKDPAEQLAMLKRIATWENPGEGSYYDGVSSVAKGPRVKTISDDATDVAWWDSGKSRKRLSSQLFQREPALDYVNLDPGARYIIRVAGYGEALLRVDGQRLSPTIYNKEENSFKEWIVPLSLTQDGKISVTFDGPEESDLNWRKNSKISDVWLLKE